jgi:hypothetical protein
VALLASSSGALSDAETSSEKLRANGQSCGPKFSNYAGATPCEALAAQTAKVDALHNVGLIPLVVGGAAIGGALLYALWPSKTPANSTSRLRAVPMLSRGEGGLLVSGSF